MGNPFVHLELRTPDSAAAKAFYEQLFDWGLKDVAVGHAPFTMIMTGEGPGGTIGAAPLPQGRPQWLAYVEVADAAAAAEKARRLGATVLQERTELPGIGCYAVIADPSGAPLGLWESKPGS